MHSVTVGHAYAPDMRSKRNGMTIVLMLLLSIVSTSSWFYSKSETSQLFGTIISEVDTKSKKIALTFDDGPTRGKTDALLNILDASNVKATFFLTGNEIEKNFDEAVKIVKSGHDVANHSYSHKRMVFRSIEFVSNEIKKTNELIRETGFSKEIYFRPPYGRKLFNLPRYLEKEDIKTIMWNVAPDSDLPLSASVEELVEHALENTKPGSIILMHTMYDSRKNSLNSISRIISELKEIGYEFVTISQLLQEPGA